MTCLVTPRKFLFHSNVSRKVQNVLTFNYYTLQLKRKNWREFINKRNEAALALLGKMGDDDHKKAKVQLELLCVLVKLEVNLAREDFVNGILKLKKFSLIIKAELPSQGY